MQGRRFGVEAKILPKRRTDEDEGDEPLPKKRKRNLHNKTSSTANSELGAQKNIIYS